MKTIKTTDWQQFKTIGKVKSNPSQTAMAYVLSDTEYEKDKYHHNIWVLHNNRHFQLTTFDQESSYVWKDDENILFVSKRKQDKESKEKSEVYSISIHGGEAKKVFDLPVQVSEIQVINDQQLLVVAVDDARYPNAYKAKEEERKEISKTRKEDKDIVVIDQIPFYSNGGSFTSHKRNRLYMYDIEEDQMTPLTSIDYQVSSVQLNANKTKALIVGKPHQQVSQLHNELVEVTLSTKKLKKKTKTKLMINAAYYVKDDIFGLYKEHEPLFGLNENSKIGKLNEKTGTFELVLDPVYSIGNSINSDIRLLGSDLIDVVNDELVMTLTVKDHSRLVKLSDHTLVNLCDWNGSIDGFSYYNGQWIVAGLLHQHAMELYTFDEKRLSEHNTSIKTNPIEPIAHEYTVDGRALRGWVMLPPKFNPKKKYPAILNIHGGPKTVYGSVYVHEMQVWAHQGYIVMYTNPTGADGQDNSFSDIRGKYGTVDYDDLMGFVDAMIEQYPAIDIDKMGVTGGSYGGFMTNWIIGHTDRFACAITQRSISNWVSFYGVSDIGYYFASDQNQATLNSEKDIDKLWWHSPLKYINFMKTPTLIIHSNLDYRCPVEQGYQLFTSLMERNIPTKMVLFNHENHDLSRSGKPKARQRRLDEMIQWFDSYLK